MSNTLFQSLHYRILIRLVIKNKFFSSQSQGWAHFNFFQPFGEQLVPTVKKEKFQLALSFKGIRQNVRFIKGIFRIFKKLTLVKDLNFLNEVNRGYSAVSGCFLQLTT